MNLENNNVIGQILTFISYLIFWYSRFKKEKKNMLLYDNISRVVTIVAFFFLKTYDGIKNTIYVIIRNIISDKLKDKEYSEKKTTFIIMLVILILLYIYGFNGISTIFIIICGIFNLYGTIMKDEQGIRIYGMIGSVFYTLFMFSTNNYIGVICEVISFISMLLSYFKYKKRKK